MGPDWTTLHLISHTPMTQVGYTAMTVIINKRKNPVTVCVDNDKKTYHAFFSCWLKIDHMMRRNLCIFPELGAGHKHTPSNESTQSDTLHQLSQS